MSRYKPMGISALPDRIRRVDERAEQLGLSRSKYIQALIDADLQAGLLDCTIRAENGKAVVKLRDGVSIMVLDEEKEEAQKVKIILAAFDAFARIDPSFKVLARANSMRNAVESAVKNLQ